MFTELSLAKKIETMVRSGASNRDIVKSLGVSYAYAKEVGGRIRRQMGPTRNCSRIALTADEVRLALTEIGSLTAAAKKLGCSKMTLSRRLRKEAA